MDVDEIQKRIGEGQLVFVLLLSLARQSPDVTQPSVIWTAAVELDGVIATALEALATRVAGGLEPPVPELENSLNVFERAMAGTDALDKEAGTHLAGRLALYRTLVAAINRLSSGISEYKTRQIPESLLERGASFESRETRIN